MQSHFKNITDPRQPWKTVYNLIEIIQMTICAVVSGNDYWDDIVDFCKVKETWFRERLGLELKNGIPSHDTFQRVFQLIDPYEFELSFISWVKSIAIQTKGEIVSIDGKTLCGSQDTKAKAIHMVSAWANANQLVLGQVKTLEKSNEITAVPILLELLELKGCIVTIDAMGCQKDIAEKIVDAEADYVLSLKGNQGSLHEDVKLYFEAATQSPKQYPVLTHETLEQGHGRIEKRFYTLTDDIAWLPQLSEWTGLKAIGMVRSVVESKGKTSEETRYFISTVTEVKTFAKAVRGHWGIENSLHWCLDVVFNEDLNRTRKDNSAENFAVIRHMAVNILKRYPVNMSLARKRRKCAYDPEFMAAVICSIMA